MIKVINKKYRKQEYNITPITKKIEDNVMPLVTTTFSIKETPVPEIKKEKTSKKVNNSTEKQDKNG